MKLVIIVIDNQIKFNVTQWVPNDGGEKASVISLTYRNAIVPCKKRMVVAGMVGCIRIADVHDNLVINIDYAISSSRIPGRMNRSVAFHSGARSARGKRIPLAEFSIDCRSRLGCGSESSVQCQANGRQGDEITGAVPSQRR